MVQALLAIHLVTALIIIGLILMQQGKGAEAGASFGAGASQTFFGSAGSWNFFSRMTAIFATVFFITSIALAVVAKNNAVVDDPFVPAMEEADLPQPSDVQGIPEANPEGDNVIPSAPAQSDNTAVPEVPAVEETESTPADDVPEQEGQ